VNFCYTGASKSDAGATSLDTQQQRLHPLACNLNSPAQCSSLSTPASERQTRGRPASKTRSASGYDPFQRPCIRSWGPAVSRRNEHYFVDSLWKRDEEKARLIHRRSGRPLVSAGPVARSLSLLRANKRKERVCEGAGKSHFVSACTLLSCSAFIKPKPSKAIELDFCPNWQQVSHVPKHTIMKPGIVSPNLRQNWTENQNCCHCRCWLKAQKQQMLRT